MRKWPEDENEHVRRLASEGSRPRLPWSFQLKNLIADPAPTGSIIERLKADPSLYVRKSVANHLNDIGKDNPDLLIERLSGWDIGNKHTSWIVRHALQVADQEGRSPRAGADRYDGKAQVKIEHFAVTPAEDRARRAHNAQARLLRALPKRSGS